MKFSRRSLLQSSLFAPLAIPFLKKEEAKASVPSQEKAGFFKFDASIPHLEKAAQLASHITIIPAFNTGFPEFDVEMKGNLSEGSLILIYGETAIVVAPILEFGLILIG